MKTFGNFIPSGIAGAALLSVVPTQPQGQATASPASAASAGPRRSSKKRLVLPALALLLAVFALSAGQLLVTDRPEKSDVIVVLAGDSMDQRYNRGMELLRAGYAKHLFLDASSEYHYFGRKPAEYAAAFLEQDAGDMRAFVSVCPFAENSTVAEARNVGACLAPLHPQKVLLVTSDFHSARALSIFAHKLPQYQWSVAAARDPSVFGTSWWRRREWAKTTFEEWLKVAWWNAVDRWK